MTQASLALPSGRLLISMQEFDDELPRIRLNPGTYAVRVYSNGLHTISEDGLVRSASVKGVSEISTHPARPL